MDDHTKKIIMIKFNDIPIEVEQFFKILDENNLLIAFNDNDMIDKIGKRLDPIAKILEAKYMIITDKDFFNKYKKFWSQFFITEDELYQDYMQQTSAMILSQFEFLKRFLRMILDLKKLKIKEIATLGEIITSISKNSKLSKSKLQNLFNLEMRDVIAHDSWYYENKDFCYKKKDGSTIQLTFEEFHDMIKNLSELMALISVNWFQYVPDLELKRARDKKLIK